MSLYARCSQESMRASKGPVGITADSILLGKTISERSAMH